jgi:hypothetical protein
MACNLYSIHVRIQFHKLSHTSAFSEWMLYNFSLSFSFSYTKASVQRYHVTNNFRYHSQGSPPHKSASCYVTDVCRQTVTCMFCIQIFYVTAQRCLLDFIRVTIAVTCIYKYVYIFYHSVTRCMLRKSIKEDSLMVVENVSRNM